MSLAGRRLVAALLYVSLASCVGPQQHTEPSPSPPSVSAPADVEELSSTTSEEPHQPSVLSVEEEHPEGAPAVVSPSPSAKDIARAKELALTLNAHRTARDTYQVRQTAMKLVLEAPLTPQALEARLLLARDAVNRSDWPGVVTWLASVVDFSKPPVEALRLLAQGYEREGKVLEASQVWATLFEQVDARVAKHLAASMWLDLALRTGQQGVINEAVDKLKMRYANVVALLERGYDLLTVEKLHQALGLAPEFEPQLALLAVRHHCQRPGDQVCVQSADLARRSADPATVEEATQSLAVFQDLVDVQDRAVGVLLPLSGAYQAHGQAALEALQMALKGHDITLKVRDTAGRVEDARRAARELILEEGVVALIGPIGVQESSAAIDISTRYGLAHAILANRPELSRASSTVFRLGVSRQEEAAALAKYARLEMGIGRVAILASSVDKDPAVFSFWDEFVRLGGEIRGVEFYAQGTRDFKDVIGRLLRTGPEGESSPDFDALFISERPKHLKRLLGFLAYHQLNPRRWPQQRPAPERSLVQLLGTHDWNTLSVLHPQRLTDNAVFTDGFSDHDSLEVAHDFSQRFQARYRRHPTAFEARVYDTTSLIVRCLSGQDPGQDELSLMPPRQRFLHRLRSARHVEGATGTISVVEGVGVMLQPRILTVHGQTIRPRLSEEEERLLRRQP